MSDQQSGTPSRIDRMMERFDQNEPHQTRMVSGLLRACVLAWFCMKQLRRHRAEGMAAELTYRTVFSLIPVLVLGLVMFRIVGGLEDVQTKVEAQLYDFFGVPDVVPPAYLEEIATTDAGADAVTSESDGTDEDSTDGATLKSELMNTESFNAESFNPESLNSDALGADPTQSNLNQPVTAAGQDAAVNGDERFNDNPLNASVDSNVRQDLGKEDETRSSIRRRMQEISRYVAAIDFRSIGIIGFLLFVYAAVALANTAETLFNRVFDVTSNRPLHLRLAIHWSMITLGSGLLAMSLLMSSQVIEWFGSFGANSGTQQILRQFLSFTASWVLLFLLYTLIPNLKVSLRAAATGSLVSAFFWELGKWSFQIYIAKAVPYSAIYGSIGLLPLFLLWIYLTWWIVLFGLILTQTLQSFGAQSLRGLLEAGKEGRTVSPEWLLPMIVEIAHGFNSGQPLTIRELSKRLRISTVDAARAGETLITAKMANQIEAAHPTLTLARPAETISLSEILELSAKLTRARQHDAWITLTQLDAANAHNSKHLTLASLLDHRQKNHENTHSNSTPPNRRPRIDAPE